MSISLPAGPWQMHTHPAMNTLFAIRLKMADERKSAALAGECFRQLENLESLLSRYREDSDISAVNNLRAGESLLLHEETWSCLRIALEAHAMTAGLFDVTIGSLTAPERTAELHGRLSLNPDRPEITCIEPGRQIDLGAIGKGYALDRMADTLRELEVGDFLLSAGASTHLALGDATWPMELIGDSESRTIELQNNSLSASGTGIQGNHIIHPFLKPEETSFPRRVWVVANSAALSDALSTACFLATSEEREKFLSAIPDLADIIVEDRDGNMIHPTRG
ncbi:MAG: FAD:protein FMN transferase [Verrucomicrobiaceae bacterium]|nr:MAG: FAD:protein FMN transferase [Verrucomicrobiaceae bacterium]